MPPKGRKASSSSTSTTSSSSTSIAESPSSQEEFTSSDGNVNESARARSLRTMRECADRIKSGVYETVEPSSVKPQGTKLAPLWTKFLYVRHATTKHLMEAAMCKACGAVLSYHERRTGTSNLTRHAEKCSSAGVTHTLQATVVDPPKEAKQDFAVACAHFCAMGLRAPETLRDEGMVALIQKALDLGVAHAQRGRLDARKLIPCPTTVKKVMSAEAEKAREATVKQVLPAIKEYRCAATTDCYTDDYKKEKYVALTLHFIDMWKVNNRLLFITSLDGEACTSSNLLKALETNFEKSGIHPNLFRRLKFVTDAGSDVKKALEAYEWFYCIAHAINIVLKTALSVKYAVIIEEMLEACGAAQDLIDLANAWIREARQKLPKNSAIISKLKCSNPQSNGHLPPLMSVCLYYEPVRKAMKGPPTNVISEEQIGGMRELVSFLTPFDLDGKRESSPQVSTSRYPSLVKHLESCPHDSDIVKTMKEAVTTSGVLLPMIPLIVIEMCKELVTYLKRSGISQKLEHTVKQEVATRWNSIFDMLISILREWDNIKELSTSTKGGKSKVEDIEIEMVQTLVDFLAPFASLTDRLQGQNYPTLPYATLAFEKLLSHCLPKGGDCAEIAAVRERAYRLLCEKIVIKMDHKIAAFLCPRLKHLSICASEDDRKEVYECVRQRLKENAEREQPQPGSASEPGEPQPSTSTTASAAPRDDVADAVFEDEDESSPAPKRARPSYALSDAELFGCYLLQPSSAETKDEVDRYREMAASEIGVAPEDKTGGIDPLHWWETQGAVRFPGLSKLALQVLAIPATGAPSERTFSDLGNLMDDKRTCLQPSTISDTLSLRDFLRSKMMK